MPGKMARWSLGFDMDGHGSRQCSPRPSRAPPGPPELSLAALAPLRQALLPLQGLAGSSGALLDSAEPFRGDGPPLGGLRCALAHADPKPAACPHDPWGG